MKTISGEGTILEIKVVLQKSSRAEKPSRSKEPPGFFSDLGQETWVPCAGDRNDLKSSGGRDKGRTGSSEEKERSIKKRLTGTERNGDIMESPENCQRSIAKGIFSGRKEGELNQCCIRGGKTDP